MKYHLSRIVDGHHVSIEEFTTILARASATLNSRPLTPISNSPDDFGALTPFHFLTLCALRVPVERDLTELKNKSNRWQLVQQMTQHLFKRWSSQYLQTLQHKYKWLDLNQNIRVGTMVLVHQLDSSVGPQRWRLGRVDAVFPGLDGRVRIVDVRVPGPTADGTGPSFKILRRPITCLSPLPLDEALTNAHARL